MSTRFPTSLSPSRANDFLNCPLLFRLRSIDRLPEAPSPAALRGTLVHSALENLFDLPAAERTVDAASALLAQAWAELSNEDPESASVLIEELSLPEAADPDAVARAVLAPAGPLLDAYFALEDPRRLEPHAREFGLSTTIGGAQPLELRGFADRIDKTPDGAVRIVDYKTGRSPAGGFESKAMFQMRFYALAWWRMTGERPKLLQLMYLGNQEVLAYEPDEAELLATERKILALRDTIAKAYTDRNFAPRPSRLCDWCSFKPICPAWDGDPPDFPAHLEWLPAQPRDGIEE